MSSTCLEGMLVHRTPFFFFFFFFKILSSLAWLSSQSLCSLSLQSGCWSLGLHWSTCWAVWLQAARGILWIFIFPLKMEKNTKTFFTAWQFKQNFQWCLPVTLLSWHKIAYTWINHLNHLKGITHLNSNEHSHFKPSLQLSVSQIDLCHRATVGDSSHTWLESNSSPKFGDLRLAWLTLIKTSTWLWLGLHNWRLDLDLIQMTWKDLTSLIKTFAFF